MEYANDLVEDAFVKWRDTRGAISVNAMIRHAAFVGTILIEGSYDGVDTSSGGADLTLKTVTVGAVDNLTDIACPFVRLRVSAYTSGTINAGFLYVR